MQLEHEKMGLNNWIMPTKELSFCHKLKSSDPNIFAISLQPLIFQTYIILSLSINRLKYLRFVAKTQFLYNFFLAIKMSICMLDLNLLE